MMSQKTLLALAVWLGSTSLFAYTPHALANPLDPSLTPALADSESHPDAMPPDAASSHDHADGMPQTEAEQPPIVEPELAHSHTGDHTGSGHGSQPSMSSKPSSEEDHGAHAESHDAHTPAESEAMPADQGGEPQTPSAFPHTSDASSDSQASATPASETTQTPEGEPILLPLSTAEMTEHPPGHRPQPSPPPTHEPSPPPPVQNSLLAPGEDWPEPIHDNEIFSMFLVDQLEYRVNDGEDTGNWDAIGWIGGDYQRLWIKTEGSIGLETADGEAEVQLLYGQLIAPFWDLQVGLRYDQHYGAEGDAGRAFGVIGVQGLTPYMFEVDAAVFVSHQGDISARLGADYEVLITQKLVLQTEFETNLALQSVQEFEVGSGLVDIELGLRLRYEVSRNFAPYVGVSWRRLFGETATFARENGESTDIFSVVGGIRLMF